MTTKTKSFFVLAAAAAAVASLSCAGKPPQTFQGAGQIMSPEYPAQAGADIGQADELSNSRPSPVEKISQAVFPIPDILCTDSPNANERTASHLEEAVTAALDDLVKPGHAKVNMPGGPIVRVHAEAGILVFSGTWEQTELVRNTMQALKDVAQERESKERERETQSARREMERSVPMLPND